MIRCDEVRERLPDYLYELLPEWQEEEIAAHVRECGNCGAALRQVAGEFGSLDAWAVPGPTSDTCPEFMRRLRQHESVALSRTDRRVGVARRVWDSSIMRLPGLVRHWEALPRGTKIAVTSVSVAAVAALAILMVALPGQRTGVAQFEQAAPAPAVPLLTYDTCLALKRSGRLQEAADGLRAIIAADESHVEAHYALAWVLIKLDDPDAARFEFRRVIDLAPGSAEARGSEGALARLAG